MEKTSHQSNGTLVSTVPLPADAEDLTAMRSRFNLKMATVVPGRLANPHTPPLGQMPPDA